MATVPTSSILRGATPSADDIAAPRARGWRTAFLGSLPNVLVFGLLAAVFYAGHHTGWKLPKFSELSGVTAKPADDWCEEHSVAETACLECQPALKPTLPTFGWCELHGVNECVINHPELAQTKGEPQRPAYDTAAAIGVRPRPVNNSVNTLHAKIVQFASAAAVEKAGVQVDVVGTAPMREEIVAPGEVNFDPTRVAHLSSRASGTVWRVLKHVGQPVAAGEALALVEAAGVGQANAALHAVSDLRTATARLDRLKGLGDASPAVR
jgi:cobalt-zinc-cadmium efflux system membrane fusion protein